MNEDQKSYLAQLLLARMSDLNDSIEFSDEEDSKEEWQQELAIIEEILITF